MSRRSLGGEGAALRGIDIAIAEPDLSHVVAAVSAGAQEAIGVLARGLDEREGLVSSNSASIGPLERALPLGSVGHDEQVACVVRARALSTGDGGGDQCPCKEYGCESDQQANPW